MKTTIVQGNFFHTQVVASYAAKVAKEEVISSIAKILRREARDLARQIVESMDVKIYLKNGNVDGVSTVGIVAERKYASK